MPRCAAANGADGGPQKVGTMKKSSKKAGSALVSARKQESGNGNGHVAASYQAAVTELQRLGGSDEARRKVEQSPLREARGQDVLALHATLKALETAHTGIHGDIGSLRAEVDGRANALDHAIEAAADRSSKELEAAHKALAKDLASFRAVADERFAALEKQAGKHAEEVQEQLEQGFAAAQKTLAEDFEKTWTTLREDFEALDERTRTNIEQLRQELTQSLDQRFTRVDQAFAATRGDLEVIKALQMELIKERIGRPELKR